MVLLRGAPEDGEGRVCELQTETSANWYRTHIQKGIQI